MLMAPKRDYPSLPVSRVEVLIHKSDAVLLLKLASEPNSGKWGLPGGVVKLGETVEEAVRREAKDQAGLDVNLEGMLDVLDEIHHDGKGKVRFHHVLIGYLASPRKGKVVLSAEATEYKWFTAAEVRSVFASDNTKRIVQKYLNRPPSRA
jgi:ADP-ribose pyrophosphatase YjhB (NUDIX family)